MRMQLTLDFPPELYSELAEVCADYRITRSEFAVQVIEAALAARRLPRVSNANRYRRGPDMRGTRGFGRRSLEREPQEESFNLVEHRFRFPDREAMAARNETQGVTTCVMSAKFDIMSMTRAAHPLTGPER